MILADTSVWIDQLRAGDPGLIGQLALENIVMHPWVIGEIALGNLAHREQTMQVLRELPPAPVIDVSDVAELIETRSLHGLGIGLVDVQLLASTLAVTGTTLWTRDKRLLGAASQLGVAYMPAHSDVSLADLESPDDR